MDDPVANFGRSGLCVIIQHGLAESLIGVTQHFESKRFQSSLRIQVTGRFRRQDQCRPVDDGTRQGNALLLSPESSDGRDRDAPAMPSICVTCSNSFWSRPVFAGDLTCNLNVSLGC